MSKLSIAMLVVGLAPVSVFGGVIRFSPETAWIDPSVDSPIVKFDVFVESLVGVDDAFTSVDILFASVDGLDLVSFVFETSLPAVLTSVDTTCGFIGCLFGDQIKAGLFSVSPIAVTNPLLLGSLVVDTTGLSFGKYEVIVDGDRDGPRSFVSNGGNNDLLFGTGSVSVVPEPTTISLIGIVSLALIHRRRAGGRAEPGSKHR